MSSSHVGVDVVDSGIRKSSGMIGSVRRQGRGVVGSVAEEMLVEHGRMVAVPVIVQSCDNEDK